MKLLANTCLEIFNAMPTAEQQKFLSIVNNQKVTTKQTKTNNALKNEIKAKILRDHHKRHNNTSRNNNNYSFKSG